MSASQLNTEKGDRCMFALFYYYYFHHLHEPIKLNSYSFLKEKKRQKRMNV